MHQPASLTAGVALLLISLAQLTRVLFAVPVVAGGIDIPVWMSGVAFAVMGTLGYWLLRERANSRKSEPR